MACCETTGTGAGGGAPRAPRLEFLFLDEAVCRPCRATGEALDAAVEITAAPLAALGVTLEVERVHVATREAALARGLETSPTIRIDGRDIDPARTEGACGTCGDIAGGRTTVTCRTWRWRGAEHPSAPVGRIVEAILAAALGGDVAPEAALGGDVAPEAAPGRAALPDNLEGFFAARDAGAPRCC